MGHSYIGCSGWAYSTWRPDFYPAKLSPKKFLEYYAAHLNSVEVNYTFRALPTSSMLDAWLGATAPDFRFSFKAPQRITHVLRLKHCTEALAAFLRAIDPIVRAGRIGLVLFQLPPNFKLDCDRLGSFLADAAATELRMAFEFRHESWFVPETYAMLRGSGVALCIAESDALETPDLQTAPFRCYRLRKSDYTAEELATLREKLKTEAEEGDVFAYFKHEDAPTGALRAVKLLRELR